jgi:hypothetical protein
VHQAEHNKRNAEAGMRLMTAKANRLFTASVTSTVDYSIAHMVICFDGFIVSYNFPEHFAANNTPQILTADETIR